MQEFLKGLGGGIVLIPLEVMISIMITTVITVNQTAQGSIPQTSPWSGVGVDLLPMLGLFALLNIIESVLIGLGRMDHSIGYCLGAIIGIMLFAGSLKCLYPDSIWSVVGIILIVILGIVIKITIVLKKSKEHSDWEYGY